MAPGAGTGAAYAEGADDRFRLVQAPRPAARGADDDERDRRCGRRGAPKGGRGPDERERGEARRDSTVLRSAKDARRRSHAGLPLVPTLRSHPPPRTAIRLSPDGGHGAVDLRAVWAHALELSRRLPGLSGTAAPRS